MKKPQIHCAIVGCGNISDIYITNLLRFPHLKLVACCDIIPEKAKEKAEQYHLEPKSFEEILNSPDIQLIVNLTPPSSHFEVSLRCIENKKHVYSEKPLALSLNDARVLNEEASKNQVCLGCAPDTFLGSSWQTAKKIIIDGWIGNPISATAFMLCRGHESWHPSPEFYYQEGGGPLFDMGPYYLTALVFLLGPVKSVTALGKTTFTERKITSLPKFGKLIPVETLTHISTLLEFSNGVHCTMIMSFDTWAHNLPWIEIYGEMGTLSLPDPNQFSGTTRYYNQYNKNWMEFPTLFDIFSNFRGLGVAFMALGIINNTHFPTEATLALHVVEVIEKILLSVDKRSTINLETDCIPPELLNPSQFPDVLPSIQ